MGEMEPKCMLSGNVTRDVEENTFLVKRQTYHSLYLESTLAESVT